MEKSLKELQDHYWQQIDEICNTSLLGYEQALSILRVAAAASLEGVQAVSIKDVIQRTFIKPRFVVPDEEKVYVLYGQEYAGVDIRGIYSTLEKAQAARIEEHAKLKYSANYAIDVWYEIAEVELDTLQEWNTA